MMHIEKELLPNVFYLLDDNTNNTRRIEDFVRPLHVAFEKRLFRHGIWLHQGNKAIMQQLQIMHFRFFATHRDASIARLVANQDAKAQASHN